MSTNPPAQSPSNDHDYELAILLSLSSEADPPPGRRTRRWSLPDPNKLPGLVATVHKLNSTVDDDRTLPEPHLPGPVHRRRRSMSDFDDLKLRVAHLSHSQFRDVYRLQPVSNVKPPSVTFPRRGVRVTRWRVINTLFIASFGFYKSVLTFQGQMTAPTALDWLLGTFWATVSYWVGLLEDEDPALATWLFEDDVWPAVRFFLNVTSRVVILFFGWTFPFMSLILDATPEGAEPIPTPYQFLFAFPPLIPFLLGLLGVSVMLVDSWGPVVAQSIGKALSKVKRLYLRIEKRVERKKLSLWITTMLPTLIFLMFSGCVRFLEKIGAITIDGPMWWVVRAITGGRSPFALPDHVQTPFQRGWDATVALGQGALWFVFLTIVVGSLVVVHDSICAEFFPQWWDAEENHEEDLIDFGIQSEPAPAGTSPRPSPSSAVVLPESRPVVINDVLVSNCLVVVNLLSRNVPDDRGFIFVANMRLSAMPRINQIVAALEKDEEENSQFHRKVRKWGLERTVVAFNRMLWSFDDARYDTTLAGYTELGRMDTVINDENAVVLPVLDGSGPAAERLRLLYGGTAETTCPIFQVFFTHLSTRATSRAESSSSVPYGHLPPPIPSLPARAVTRNLAHLAGADLGSRYPVMETAVEVRHQLSGFYRHFSRLGLAAAWLWQRSRRQNLGDVQLIDV